jgi:serine/threonine protein phosphatase PrpC
MRCVNCQAELEPSFAFCENCGTQVGSAPAAQELAGPDLALSLRCACGSSSFDGDGFCGACAKRVLPHDAVEWHAEGKDLAVASHRGRTHADNQDFGFVRRLPEGGAALVVADGVSTAYRSRLAAEVAVAQVMNTLEENGFADEEALLKLALTRAHAAICRLPHFDTSFAEPQATVVAGLVRQNRFTFAWVGDSRAYLLHGADSQQLTVDDSWLQEQVAAGMPYEEALRSPDAHCIMQCLGMRDDDLDIHTSQVSLAPGASVLLCSDGLWNYFPDALTLHAKASEDRDASGCCAQFVELANAAGGIDNVTVALYRHPG